MTAKRTTKRTSSKATKTTAKKKAAPKRATKKRAVKKKTSSAEFDDLVNFQIFEAQYKTKLTKGFKEREAYVPEDKSKLAAVIPGTILKLYKKEGDKVKFGDKLLVLEAMKMKNQILSPVNGVIKKFHIETGINVAKRQLLVEFELDEEENKEV